MEYFLISFYPVTENRWLVYGHISIGWNDALGEYATKEKALQRCFQFGLPVIMGQGGIVDSVLEKLTA